MEASENTICSVAKETLSKPITLNFTEPIVFVLNLYIALIYALLFCWLESYSVVFEDIYGFSVGQKGLTFLAILVGALIAYLGFATWSYRVLEPKLVEKRSIKPEERFPSGLLGCFCIPICLFWFGWSVAAHIH